MFWLSKIFWILFLPSNLVLWLLIAGVVALVFGHRRLGNWFLVPAISIAVLATVLPVGNWLLLPLERRFAPPDAKDGRPVDGIVVLGGALDLRAARPGAPPALNSAADRIAGMIVLSRRHPKATIVFTGGSGDVFDQGPREADQVRRLLAEIGADTARIRFERDSRNTVENARFAKSLVRPAKGQRWLLVTSAAHMPRAIGAFRRQGWSVEAYPVDYNAPAGWTWRGPYSLSRGLGQLDGAAQVWIGLAAYWIFGYTSSLFPAPGE